MPHITGTTNVQAFDGDRDRINELAAQLTAEGPGRYGQREALRWLLDFRESATEMIRDYATRENTPR